MADSPSAQRGRQARRQLLSAAAELIGEVGWNAVSTRLLAERAGLRSGLVHYHFASLQALLREAAMETIHGMLNMLAAEAAANPTALVDRWVTALDAYSGRDPTSLLYIETYLAATRDDELRRQLSEVLLSLRTDLETRLTAAGVADPRGNAVTVLAALDGFVLHKALSPDVDATLVLPAFRRLTSPDTDQGAQT